MKFSTAEATEYGQGLYVCVCCVGEGRPPPYSPSQGDRSHKTVYAMCMGVLVICCTLCLSFLSP